MGRQTKIKIETVNFHPRHLEIMDVRDLEKVGIFRTEDFYERMEQINKESDEAYTFMCEGRIVGCAGFNLICPGVAMGWIIPSIYVEKYRFQFCRAIREYLDRIMKEFNLHRFQATSFTDDVNKRWMEWLGFKEEGIMRKSTQDKKDQCIFARVV